MLYKRSYSINRNAAMDANLLRMMKNVTLDNAQAILRTNEYLSSKNWDRQTKKGDAPTPKPNWQK